MPISSANLEPLVRKLESLVHLSKDEKRTVMALPVTVRNLQAHHDIVRDQDRPSHCCLILEGFAFRYKLLEAGKRQILSFHIAGDIPDLQSLHLTIMDHSLATLGPSKVAFITHETVRELIKAHPRIGQIFWRDTLIDAAVFREWMVSIGRREAYARLAHLFCEFFLRLRAVGLTDGYTCSMPLTQADIGDALGLSTVHVNRTLQQLRADRLISLSSGALTIRDWDGLEAAGQFDPTYLHVQTVAA